VEAECAQRFDLTKKILDHNLDKRARKEIFAGMAKITEFEKSIRALTPYTERE